MTVRLVVLMLVLAVVGAKPSAADVAGTGTFDLFLGPPPPTVTFDGAISFDSGKKMVLGKSVSLAPSVGDMTWDAESTDPAAGAATFTLSADADETDFSFDSAGSASCETVSCLSGRVTLAGPLEITLDDAGVLPAGAYTFDGTAEVDQQGEGLGTFAINAFPLVATPAGAGVQVTSGVQTFFDSVSEGNRTFEARAVFDDVMTAGTTSFVALSAVSGTLPTGVALDTAVSVFVDVQTTAVLGGGVQLCLAFTDAGADGIVDGTAIAVSQLRLLHAAAVGSDFTEVTSAPSAGAVCGTVPAPGVIVLGVGEPGGGTTTTTVATGATSTTSTIGGGATTTTSTLGGGESTTTTTSTTLPGGGSSTTTSTMPGESTTTTLALPGVTTTTCGQTPSTSTTSSTTATTFPTSPLVTSTTVALTPTTSSTLPVCATALDCLALTIAGPLCPGETLNQKLAAVILKKLAKAQKALLNAQGAGGGKKAGKLLAKASKQLDRIGLKADAFVARRRKPISAECRDRIRTAIARVKQQLDAKRI